MSRHKFFKHGFTLIETILVVAITATMAVIGISYFMGAPKTKLLDKTAEEIVSYLKYAQQNSVSQKDNQKWGVHFENPSSGRGFYALYTGDSYSTPIETKYLPSGIEFQTPAVGSSIDISFLKLTGFNAASTTQLVVIQGLNNATKTITVFPQGLITYY